jgi:hypothetical protein
LYVNSPHRTTGQILVSMNNSVKRPTLSDDGNTRVTDGDVTSTDDFSSEIDVFDGSASFSLESSFTVTSDSSLIFGGTHLLVGR